MIQRKQTLFLLGSTCISVLLLYLPLYESLPDPSSAVRQIMLLPNTLLSILDGAVGILSLIAIFLFKMRNIQIRMCNLALLLTCVLIGLIFFQADSMSSGMNLKIHYLYGIYLPLFQLLFIFLATLFIRHDEKLVRSADRLR